MSLNVPKSEAGNPAEDLLAMIKDNDHPLDFSLFDDLSKAAPDAEQTADWQALFEQFKTGFAELLGQVGHAETSLFQGNQESDSGGEDLRETLSLNGEHSNPLAQLLSAVEHTGDAPFLDLLRELVGSSGKLPDSLLDFFSRDTETGAAPTDYAAPLQTILSWDQENDGGSGLVGDHFIL